ncbi:MAG: EMC3/TMCO1 family protein [Candidatus Thermoplasmatota archaeon]|jgi:uncharacterized membrane protein (DUF106 family)|nr:EMC3/TMCO1 family protein [Candidatus Thermoplasmatota archaeon]MCL5790220.1 EMC3/TMCO1 family protein [Candidatus Thermoplasmatota archaeon]
MSQRPGSIPQTREQQQAMSSGMRTQMLYMVLMFLVIFVYSIPAIRNAFAIPMTYILQPVVGFNFKYPLFTILSAALVTGFINTIARHFFTDYFGMAEMQHKNRKLQQRYREAIRTRNKSEMDAVRAEQSKSMQDSMKLTQQQMKPTMVTMLISVLIYAWLIKFMYYIESSAKLSSYLLISYPFGVAQGSLMHPIYGGFPVWMLLYLTFSVTFLYPLQYGLKLWYMSRKVRNEDNYIRPAGQR